MSEPVTLAHAQGAPSATGRLRTVPDDFVVREVLGFEPTGSGQHVLVHVRKRSVDTRWAVRELARAADLSPFDVGYAGMKDRHAVAEQWFSLDLGGLGRSLHLKDLPAPLELLAMHAHDRKLKIGAHAGNRFVLKLRCLEGNIDGLSERFELLERHGVPNYFGPQRFGRGGGNLRVAEQLLVEGLPLRSRDQRSFAYSAARSFLYNRVLNERVEAGSWNRLLMGDVANPDAGDELFPVSQLDRVLIERVERLDVHATGPLWGSGADGVTGEPALIEERICAGHALAVGLEDHGIARARRALRLAVRQLEWDIRGDQLEVAFELRRGGYATSVLRELLDARDVSRDR
jgi:tRNA pseudouridine13 synthase